MTKPAARVPRPEIDRSFFPPRKTTPFKTKPFACLHPSPAHLLLFFFFVVVVVVVVLLCYSYFFFFSALCLLLRTFVLPTIKPASALFSFSPSHPPVFPFFWLFRPFYFFSLSTLFHCSLEHHARFFFFFHTFVNQTISSLVFGQLSLVDTATVFTLLNF